MSSGSKRRNVRTRLNRAIDWTSSEFNCPNSSGCITLDTGTATNPTIIDVTDPALDCGHTNEMRYSYVQYTVGTDLYSYVWVPNTPVDYSGSAENVQTLATQTSFFTNSPGYAYYWRRKRTNLSNLNFTARYCAVHTAFIGATAKPSTCDCEHNIYVVNNTSEADQSVAWSSRQTQSLL